ncbi:uncharacterized protein LOC128660534 isoform X2 [Bombina bombina]|nr:uncharacterized protein LOC128660534 isoform X2 [Bombina bombina]
MNTTAPPPPENGQYSANQQRPFFYAQPTAQLPFPNPWYLGQLYNPYCMPGPGYRGGNPYYPFYSLALHEYPGFYVPQHQMNARLNRRPHFNPHPPSPMFYHATRFRHYSSPGKRTETKETQTDQRLPDYVPKKHTGTDGNGSDGRSTECQSSGVSSTQNDSNLETVEMSLSPVSAAQERDFHKNACNSSQYHTMPPGSYAYEKEEVRIEYGGGSPAIQMWKSYKETIPIYDVAVVKEMPESVVQRDLYCEGVLYGPRTEREELSVQSVAFSNEEETSLPHSMCLNDVQETETQTTVVSNKPNLKLKAAVELESENMMLHHDVASPVYIVQQALSPENWEDDYNTIEEAKTDPELIVGQDPISETQYQGPYNFNEVPELASKTSMWEEDPVEKFVPSPSWVACFDNVETNYDYDLYMAQRKQKRPSILSITSEELSSRDEGSSMDNASVSYFVPDYMLRKGIYSFRKSSDGSDREKIQSSGSLKEDIAVKHDSSQYKNHASGIKVKNVSSRGRKLGVPVRTLNKKLYSLKKKPRKSQSLSEPEDSEEYWVVEEENYEEELDEDDSDEGEFYIQETIPFSQLNISKGSFFKQIAQKRILWKPPKGTIATPLIGWPVKEKLKVKKKGAYEALGQVHRQKDYEVYDYASYDEKQSSKTERGFQEMSEQKKSMQKSMGGKLQKKTTGPVVEEYWVGRGAKPKFPEPAYYLQDPTKVKEPVNSSKKKGSLKSSKRKQTRIDPEEIDEWEVPKTYLYRGHGIRRGGTGKK